ncbi:lysine-specific histone demethylase 1B-like [Dendronephthya gigantea]|uniref:lysine-specific histone demethylase 1B-like n=1 Tax=Dendronephthya gigantea TaxID=151771 RepID=UPI00106C377D|nr:lysine-specific histone demethylase 1B-like [Dendronephthya gigantea]
MSARRASKKKVLSTSFPEEPKYRKCAKSGCPAERPECFSNAVESCCGHGYTSRWYHLSDGEHFCNECFDHYYRSHKDGFQAYEQWKKDWNSNSQHEGNLKMFMAERILPYWVKCSDCSKWRQYPITEGDLTTDIVESWTCRSYRKLKKKNEDDKVENNLCSSEEDERVKYCHSGYWYEGLGYNPLLKFSPTASLVSSYYLDGVGLSPTDNNWEDTSVKEKLEHADVKPFCLPESDDGIALCFRPDVMEPDELKEFPEFAKIQNRYLALRNLILTLWSLNYKQILTVDRCVNNLILRGLARIAIIPQLERILRYLTLKGYINYGILQSTPYISLPVSNPNTSAHVIVIGAGAAGLGTAKQLSNFGTKVTVLEARDRIGGRVCDEKIGNITAGKGAQIMNGCVNNPLAVICDQVSALFWDQNESFPQFQGNHTLLTHGYGTVLQRMSEGLDIHLGAEVTSVDYSAKTISVTTRDGRIFIADKVVVTVPLSLLKSEAISFNPPLPSKKTDAIKRLGAGIIEKVILSFPVCFWESYSDTFGHVPNTKETRGFCGIFYDLSPKSVSDRQKKDNHVLMTVLAGNSAMEAQDMEDKEIVDRCMKLLRTMFPNETVPDPLKSIITRWGKDPFTKMAYSFVAKDGVGEDYSTLSEDVAKKIYFAGEATNRQFPQTVTGAYISGLREACKIHTDLEAD